jgi:hypothetical protein
MELTVDLVSLALRQSRGVKAQAAAALEVSFRTLHSFMTKHEADLAELMVELDAAMVDAAREVILDSLENGGLKAACFVLERKGGGWSRKTESKVQHALADRPKPSEYLPAVVDERELAASQARQLPEARPAEFVEVDTAAEPAPAVVGQVEGEVAAGVEVAPADEPEAEDPPGGKYGPCPRCAANLQAPGAWAKAEGHKGSCSKCGYPAVEQPQSLAQATLRH